MRRFPYTAATLIALFVAALLANLRIAGTSPIIWIDTFNDELEVRRCLVDDSCTLTGMSTSVPGQAHAVAWLELRALFSWLGFGLDGAHLAIQVCNALAVVLIFHLATTLGGPIAGTLAAWLVMDRIDAFARVTALYNTSPMLFLGAVLVLACTAAAARPGFVSVALAALVAAVMTNIHLACAMTGASVVWVALAAPRRRFRLAVCAGALFALATFAIAPPTWQHNLTSLVQDRAARGHLIALDVPRNPMMSWALFAIGAWLASCAFRGPAGTAYRRQVQGALAVLVPSLAVFLVAPRFGFNPEAKYIYHLKAACALAAALPIAAVASSLLRMLPAQAVFLAGQRVLPLLLALAMALPGPFGVRARVTAEDERTPTVGDVAAVARILQGEHGWSTEYMLRNLKTPYGVTLLAGLEQMGTAPGSTSAAMDGTGALLLVLDAGDLPEPLPSSWRIVRRSTRAATLLVLMQSRIDWRELMVCVQPADGSQRRCDHGTWRPEQNVYVAHLPPAGAGWRGTVRLLLPLRAAAGGFVDEIFMPRMPFVCGGRIASLPRGTVSEDGRYASLTAAESGKAEPPIVELEWEIGSPACDVMAYDGVAPFFVEGDAATVRTVATILRQQERSP